jgi:putative oligomerization/nucleic acid binding protein
MKQTLMLTILLLLIAFVSAQENDYGKVSGDTLVLKNGATFIKGQKIKLGYGSNGAKGFEFIHLSPYSIAGPVKLTSNWANYSMTVKKFEFQGTKRAGKKFFLVLAGGNLSPYWCDIVAAIEQGEVQVPGINDKKEESKSNNTSVADELKKIKDLYDSGGLTKEEYEAAKKKLLDKM